MEAFWISTGTVFLGELGDKTQLLAVMLASRFRRPWIVVAGILLATVLNHAVAGLAGSWIRTVLPDQWLHWIVGLSFIAVGLWAIKPDEIDESEALRSGRSVLWITIVSFFLAEIGDKTQIATTVLAARFDDLVQVVAGTTSGMLLADVPVVFLGAAIATRLPLTAIRWTAAGLFVVLGVTTLIWGGSWLGAEAGQAG